MSIKKSKSNNNSQPQEKDRKPSFEEMMNESDCEIEGQEVEQNIVERVSELKLLCEKIDKATQTLNDAKVALTEAVTLYRQTETKLNTAINTISGKVDTINTHIDSLITDAPKKLKITVRASDADYQKMTDIVERHRQWVIEKVGWACGDFRDQLTMEWKKTRDRYKEYDGTYLGYYAQYFFWFFCLFGIVIFSLTIFLALNSHYHWTR